MFQFEGSTPESPAPGRDRPGKARRNGASVRNGAGASLLALALLAGTGNGSVGSARAADGAPDIGPAHSGSWYNAAQSGHGFSLEVGQTANGMPQAVVYWYVYDDRGNPLFLVGQGAPQGNRLEAEFVSPVGMAYGEFDPATVTRRLSQFKRALEVMQVGVTIADLERKIEHLVDPGMRRMNAHRLHHTYHP